MWNNPRRLTSKQAHEIRDKYIPYKVTLKMLAEEYKVHYSTIYRIVRGVFY